MFDLFGFKARKQAREEARKEKEAKELEAMQEKKRIYKERKDKIDAWLKTYNDKMYSISSKLNSERRDRIDEENSICPKCGSKNVVHKVVRSKGEIHGSGSSSISGSFGGGLLSIGGSMYGSGHSKIDGEFDTYPVNRCKNCENEWNVKEFKRIEATNDFSHYSSISPGYLYRRIEEYYEMKYDPKDVKEECNSLDEKREKYCEIQSKTYLLKPYKTIPRYMVDVALYEGFTENFYFAETLDKIFNYHKDDDKYSYRMTDEMWEVVKKIIGWEGTEE